MVLLLFFAFTKRSHKISNFMLLQLTGIPDSQEIEEFEL